MCPNYGGGDGPWILAIPCPMGCNCNYPLLAICNPYSYGDSITQFCSPAIPSFAITNTEVAIPEIHGTASLLVNPVPMESKIPIIQTKVEKASITRPRLCKHAGRKPLQMIKENCGACSIRSCNIFGLCNHTANLPDKPEVVCCQTCTKYELEESPKTPGAVVPPAPLQIPMQEEVVREIEIPVSIKSIDKIPTSFEMTDVKNINIKSALDIAQYHIDINKQIKVVPKDSSISVNVEELLGHRNRE